jgi:hypothetical protein
LGEAYAFLILVSCYPQERINYCTSRIKSYFVDFIEALQLLGEHELSQQVEKYLVDAPYITQDTCLIISKKFENVCIISIFSSSRFYGHYMESGEHTLSKYNNNNNLFPESPPTDNTTSTPSSVHRSKKDKKYHILGRSLEAQLTTGVQRECWDGSAPTMPQKTMVHLRNSNFSKMFDVNS